MTNELTIAQPYSKHLVRLTGGAAISCRLSKKNTAQFPCKIDQLLTSCYKRLDVGGCDERHERKPDE